MNKIVEQLLRKEFKIENWSYLKSAHGLSKESYVATNGKRKVFIKFDVSSPALKRLAELKVAPPLISTGIVDGRPYVIQEYLEGEYPDREWFGSHFKMLVEFIKTYHEDKELSKILTVSEISYEQHVSDALLTLENELTKADLSIFGKSEVQNAIVKLKEQSKFLKSTRLVPIHADPNYKNMLLVDNKLVMLDWDDVMLSDPMRDIGLLLYWYLPQDKWNNFFQAYGTELDIDRLYWWVAKRSLSIALWFDNRGDKTQTSKYIKDFLTSIRHQRNPHA